MPPLPAGFEFQLSRAAADTPLLGAAQPRGILLDRRLDTGKSQQSHQQVANRLLRSRTDVIDLAAPALLEQQEVRLHSVVHVGEVARHVDVTGADGRCPATPADFDDLAREAGYDELVALARPDLVEGSRHHDLHRLALAPLV